MSCSCADPDSFARCGPTLTTFFFVFFLVDEGRIQIPLSAGHHRPASETPFRWRADVGPTLNAGLVARGPGPVLLRKPIFL